MIGLEASYVLLWGLAGPIIFCLVGTLMLNVATYLKKNGVLIFKGNDTSARIEFSARLKNALKDAGLVLPVLEEDQSRYPH